MKTQRTIAVIMIVGASALTAWASKDITFPAILCMLGLLGLRGRFIWNIPPRQRPLTPLLLLVLAILFALHCRYTHVRSDEAAAFAWETIARYFLASMILVLYLRSRDGHITQDRTRDAGRATHDEVRAPSLPASLGLFQLAAVLAAGQVLLLDDQYLVFRLSELLSVTLAVLYAAAGRVADDDGAAGKDRTHWTYGANGSPRFQASHVALLLLAVNVGWVAGSLLYRRVETLNLLPAWFWRGAIVIEGVSGDAARIGFSTSGRLSSILEIKEDPDTTPVLKVTCDGAPGYLRARAFETYLRSEWLNQSPAESIFSEQNAPLFGLPLLGRTYRFRLNDKSAPRSMIVRHEMMIADAIFTPLGISSIEAPFRSLERYDDDILRPYSRSGSPGYRITYSTSGNAGPPDGTQMRGMPGLPLLDPRIHQLAGKIFADCHTTAEKIEAVVGYFRTNYAYSLVMDIPPEEDKLEYFLLEASSGYCEYFASGAAILLRLAGVPTRYVTGFLVTERGEQSNSWIARNTDAHAWVEAWDEEQNEWTIVEATVQEELGEGALDDESAYQRGRGAMFLAQFLQALYDYGLFGVLAWLFESYSLLTALSVSLAFLGAATCLALWRRYRRIHLQGRGSEHREEILALRRILAAMDRKVRAVGLRRQSSETLHAFAERIRRSSLVARPPNEKREDRTTSEEHSFADWYLAYADLRYCRAISPERLRQLQRFAQDLRRAR